MSTQLPDPVGHPVHAETLGLTQDPMPIPSSPTINRSSECHLLEADGNAAAGVWRKHAFNRIRDQLIHDEVVLSMTAATPAP